MLSHVLLALVKLAVKNIIRPSMNVFPWFAAVVWGATLVMFEYQQSTIHPFLSASMTYIFHMAMIMNTELTSGTFLYTARY